jgi:AcrR family transcriptional regulator
MAERLTRTTLVARAADLSDEIGLDELTITRVGRHVGIAAPGVYRHVEDIDDLRAAIGTLAAGEVAGELARSTAGLAGPDALAAVAHTLRSWAGEHPGRYAALQVAPDLDDEEAQAQARALIETIGSALRVYELEGDDLTDAIRLLRSLLHGFITLEQGEGFKDPRDPDASFERMVRSLDPLLRSWG